MTTRHVSSLVPERQLTGSRVTGVWGRVYSTEGGVYITGSGDKRSGDVMMRERGWCGKLLGSEAANSMLTVNVHNFVASVSFFRATVQHPPPQKKK